MKNTLLIKPACVTLLAFALVGVYKLAGNNVDSTTSIFPVRSAAGDPSVLQKNYINWKKRVSNRSSGQDLILKLVSPDSHASPSAAGVITLTVETGEVYAELEDRYHGKSMALWMMQDAYLYSTSDVRGNLVQVGLFTEQNKKPVLQTNIKPALQKGFKIEQLVVAEVNRDPVTAPLLVASVGLFPRLLAAETYRSNLSGVMDYIIPAANAVEATGFPGVFNDLVTQGEDIFFNETFGGNGRTCGTCHPATNNFTIDTDFIAGLPANDPLFVAEFVPALIFGNPANLDVSGNPRRFENPALMRAFGLILENQDGMGELENRFNMRSVPHNIGMSLSVETPPQDLTPPDDRTGWSGDGAPSGVVGGIAASGRLRDFVLGAIVQHYPLTMNRSFTGSVPDFRPPTIQELDAVEAFLMSLGRQDDLELRDGFSNQLVLKDAGAEAGKVLFRDGVAGGTARCDGCHGNAGANDVDGDDDDDVEGVEQANRNFDTGIELFLQTRLTEPNITVVGEPRPVDGGFGTNPDGDFTSLLEQPGFVNENFGDMTFNTPSLVEAADTPPFFHNNAIDNLEDAIRFYNSPEFIQASDTSIPFNDTQVTQVANFLRVINAIDNVENSVLRQSQRALIALNQSPVPKDVIERILQIMIADTTDAIDVLNDGNLHNTGGLPQNAVKQLDQAKKRMQQAMNSNASANARVNQIQKAESHLNNALALMKF